MGWSYRVEYKGHGSIRRELEGEWVARLLPKQKAVHRHHAILGAKCQEAWLRYEYSEYSATLNLAPRPLVLVRSTA